VAAAQCSIAETLIDNSVGARADVWMGGVPLWSPEGGGKTVASSLSRLFQAIHIGRP